MDITDAGQLFAIGRILQAPAREKPESYQFLCGFLDYETISIKSIGSSA
ncbi:hypothetical protein [Burkholderia sp. Ax-1719]|nr:hypothetical protein [Burkholderia sp. Ax-1719]